MLGGVQDGTGWATVTAVSAVLKQAGASIDDSAVLLLANQLDDSHSPVGPMQQMRLVHWPTVIDFLEEGPTADVKNDATIPDWKKGSLVSSKTPGSSIQSARATEIDSKSTTPFRTESVVSPSCTGGAQGDCNPEVTPEWKVDERGGEFESDGGDDQRSISGSSCSGIMRVKQGLREIEAGLRDMEANGGRPPPASRGDIMDSIREVLIAKAGVLFALGSTGYAGDRKESNDKGSGREIPSGAPSDGCIVHKKNGGKGTDSLERLTRAACTAGKSGDVSALRVSGMQRHEDRVGLTLNCTVECQTSI